MKKTKFLVIRLSSIGDIVLTSPLVRCLGEQVDNAEIHFVAKQKYADLLQANPNIATIHFFNRSMVSLLKELRQEKFDYVIDLHQNFRSLRIKLALGVPSFSFRKLNLKKWLRVQFGIDLLPELHVVDRYFRTVSSFHVIPDGKGLEYYIPEEPSSAPPALPDIFRQGYVAFIIGGTYYTKRLPSSRVVEICNNINFPVVIIGGKQEIPEGLAIGRNTDTHVLNLTGKTTISQSASLIRNARLVLSNDTGMMHIAAAFGKKILSFWGNTIPEFGMTPYKADPASRMLEVNRLSCRPCSKLGYQKCPKGHFRCMNDLDIREAVGWIRENF